MLQAATRILGHEADNLGPPSLHLLCELDHCTSINIDSCITILRCCTWTSPSCIKPRSSIVEFYPPNNMVDRAAPSRIPFSFTFGTRPASTELREAGNNSSTQGNNDDVPFAQHIEYGGTRESISTVATSHHPSIVSEVSRFSFSTDASSLDDDENPKAIDIEEIEDEPIGRLLCDQSDDSLATSERSNDDSDNNVSELCLAESLPFEGNRSLSPDRAQRVPLSSQAPVTEYENTTIHLTQSRHPPFSRCRTHSEPLTNSTDRDQAPKNPPGYSPPPSYAAALQESDESETSPQVLVADGYFRAYKSKTPGGFCPRPGWPVPPRITASLQHLKFPEVPRLSSPPSSRWYKERAVVVTQIPSNQPTPLQVLQNLYHVRKLLIPYHQSLACHHAQRIEKYAKEATANIWDSRDACAFRTPLGYPQSIWGPQDESDPMPRPTFWERAVSTTELMHFHY